MIETNRPISRRQMMKTSLAATTILASTSAVKAVTKVKNSPIRLGGPVFEKYKDPVSWIAALKKLGYRFPNKRAEYIVESRKCAKSLKNLKKGPEAREWLVKNVKGLGYKEASHFLRNIGYTDVAIIDFHIVDLLADYRLIKKPKTMTKKNYLKIEKLLRKIAENVNLNLGELDLYLWYMETGKILK